jgi:hypothetical protein
MRPIPRLIAFAFMVTVTAGAPSLAQRQDGPAQGSRQGGPDGNGRGRQGGPPPRDAGRGRGPQLTVGTASIRGRVVSGGSSTPVRRATVQAAFSSESGRGEPPRSVVTDENGSFELRNLPAGRWTLRASRAGFIDQQFGQKSAFASTDPILLAEGQQFVADFRLSRGGAISGRITDEFGDPVAGGTVAAMRLQRTQQGVRLSRTGTSVPTDDNGTYRIYGLPPGQYYVSVTDPSAARMQVFTFDGNTTVSPDGQQLAIVADRVEIQSNLANSFAAIASRTSATAYAPTYYPGTASLADAQRITLGLGEEQPGINLAVVPVRAARITGRITNSNGQPIQATVALISPWQGFTPSGGRNGSGADGAFTLTNIPPGTYSLNVLGPNVGAAAPEVASMPLNVNGEDILGLNVVTGAGASVTGTVLSDNGMRLPAARMRVTATPAQNNNVASFTARSDVGATGSFDLEGLLGVYTLRFESLPSGWVVKSVSANGLDVSDSAVEFRPGERIQVRVELTDRITQVSGTVRSDRDMRGANVLIFPDEPAKWTTQSRYVRSAKVTAAGQFSVSGLPPHSRYLAVAVDYLETGDPQAPEFLQRAKAVATASFGLSAGEQKVLDLPLVFR